MPVALVIDDNRDNADSLCKMLEFLGVEVQVAYGSRTAILNLKKRIPDIIFLDITLPGVDGFEVMAYLRREPDLRYVPVVVVTADDQQETAQKARRTGALLVMVKPVELGSLEQVLERVGVFSGGLAASKTHKTMSLFPYPELTLN
jgi:CheY-like chemotaxis protein